MTCVIVLGLPRSGTSALAGALQAMGVHMGDELLPAMAGVNDKGFFEDTEFLEMHIHLMGSHTDPKIEFEQDLPQRTLDWYEKLVQKREAAHPWWGVKDPKLCFLLPYLVRYLRGPYKILVTRRPFHESVQSMRPLYGGLTMERSIQLLGRYLYCLERNLAWVDRDAVMEVGYHHMLGWPYGEGDKAGLLKPEHYREGLFERIANFLDLPGDLEALAAKGAETIDVTLRRQR